MKIVYIAGPYRAPTVNGIVKNIVQAQRRAEWVWTHGDLAICPHMNTALFLGGIVPEQQIMDRYITLIRKCDAILMIEGWHRSTGSQREHEEATRIKRVRPEFEFISDPYRRQTWGLPKFTV